MQTSNENEAQRLALAWDIAVTFNDPNFIINPLERDSKFNDQLDKIAEDDEGTTQAVGLIREAWTLFWEDPTQERQGVLVKALAALPLDALQGFSDDLQPVLEEKGPMQFSADEGQKPNEIELSAEEEARHEFDSLLRHLADVLSIDLQGIGCTRKTFIRDLQVALMNCKPTKRPRPNVGPDDDDDGDDDGWDDDDDDDEQFSASSARRKIRKRKPGLVVGSCTCNAVGGIKCRMHNQPPPRPIAG